MFIALFQKLSAATVREFRAEVSIMARLRHPNIVLFLVRRLKKEIS